jgi:BirA family biotin operon repressor/biotin-[acetyl-CoA-carboxylase] ligase
LEKEIKMVVKKVVLNLLEQYRGMSISGGQIAETLGVSRSAVWKAVKDLQKDGYIIEGVNNRGYRLCETNDILSAAGMSPYISREIRSEQIKIYDSLESTNITAKQLAIDGAEHGTVVVADVQTDGKGRYGKSFASPRGGGVYMSVILRPEHWGSSPASSTLLTSYAAVAVCEAVEAVSGKSAQIKWVNDVFIEGKKICGILTEAITDFESGEMPWIVAGIGINLTLSDELPEVAGAVFEQPQTAVTRNQLIAEVANRIVRFDGNLNIAEYRRRLMWIGERILVNGQESCELAGVDESGRLLIRKDSAELTTLSTGSITLLT